VGENVVKLNYKVSIDIDKDLIESYQCKITKKKNEYLIINPERSSWCVVNKKLYNLFVKLNKISVTNICKRANLNKEDVCNSVLKLYNLGLVTINHEHLFNANFFDKYKEIQPKLLLLRLTDRCNLKCRYCYTERSGKGNSMTFKTACGAIKSFFEISACDVHILFHGGEPLLEFKKIIRILSFIKKEAKKYNKKIHLLIQSNGTLLNKQISDFIRMEKIALGISLDGYPNLNDKNRIFHDAKGTSEIILKNLNENQPLKYAVLSTVTKDNVKELPEIVEYFQSIGCKSIKFSLFTPHGRGKRNRDMRPYQKDILNSYKKIVHKIERGIIHSIKVQNIIYYLQNIIIFDRLYMCMRSPCGASLNMLAIDVNGDVYPCDCFLGRTEFVLGNININNIQDIISSNVIGQFRDRGIDNIGRCSNCQMNRFCGSGCPARALDLYGNILKPDSCYLNKSFFNFLIWKIVESPNILDYYYRNYPNYFVER